MCGGGSNSRLITQGQTTANRGAPFQRRFKKASYRFSRCVVTLQSLNYFIKSHQSESRAAGNDTGRFQPLIPPRRGPGGRGGLAAPPKCCELHFSHMYQVKGQRFLAVISGQIFLFILLCNLLQNVQRHKHMNIKTLFNAGKGGLCLNT